MINVTTNYIIHENMRDFNCSYRTSYAMLNIDDFSIRLFYRHFKPTKLSRFCLYKYIACFRQIFDCFMRMFYFAQRKDIIVIIGTEFSYIMSKHEVKKWIDKHGTEGLLKLIKEINSGKDFNDLYTDR